MPRSWVYDWEGISVLSSWWLKIDWWVADRPVTIRAHLLELTGISKSWPSLVEHLCKHHQENGKHYFPFWLNLLCLCKTLTTQSSNDSCRKCLASTEGASDYQSRKQRPKSSRWCMILVTLYSVRRRFVCQERFLAKPRRSPFAENNVPHLNFNWISLLPNVRKCVEIAILDHFEAYNQI